MQPNDPFSPRPDQKPIERPYISRAPIQTNFTRPTADAPQQAQQPHESQLPQQPEQPGQPPHVPAPIPIDPSIPKVVADQAFQPHVTQYPQDNVLPITPPLPTVSLPIPTTNMGSATDKTADPQAMVGKQPRNWLTPVLIIIGVAVVLLITLLVVVLQKQNEPNKVFQQAFESTLTSQNVEVQTNDNGFIRTMKFDFTTPQNPVVSVSGDLSLNGSNFVLNGYGDLKNTFAEYTQLASPQMALAVPKSLNTWVQLRSNGKLAPGINTALANFADPRSALVGDVVFGNFSQAQSATLVKVMLQSKVYRYNLNDIKQTISGGQTILEYPIVLNTTALKTWNQRVITSMGLSAKDIQSSLASLGTQQFVDGTIYINKVSGQLIRLDLIQSGKTTTTLFMNRNNQALPAQPTTYLTWSKFAPYQNQIEQQAALAQSDASLDSERKADLIELNHYIQAYYATTSFYPTSADLNNQVWVSLNMQGINPDVFKDPQGVNLLLSASPTPHSYAYTPVGPNQAANCNDGPVGAKTSIDCESYKLTAILSNGKQYTLDNLSSS
jgi:hypothetical protein